MLVGLIIYFYVFSIEVVWWVVRLIVRFIDPWCYWQVNFWVGDFMLIGIVWISWYVIFISTFGGWFFHIFRLFMILHIDFFIDIYTVYCFMIVIILILRLWLVSVVVCWFFIYIVHRGRFSILMLLVYFIVRCCLVVLGGFLFIEGLCFLFRLRIGSLVCFGRIVLRVIDCDLSSFLFWSLLLLLYIVVLILELFF